MNDTSKAEAELNGLLELVEKRRSNMPCGRGRHRFHALHYFDASDNHTVLHCRDCGVGREYQWVKAYNIGSDTDKNVIITESAEGFQDCLHVFYHKDIMDFPAGRIAICRRCSVTKLESNVQSGEWAD